MEENLAQIFNIDRPIIFEDVPEGQEVIIFPDKIIIMADPDSWEDRYLVMAEAKLGEKDNLLVNFFCMTDSTNGEIRLMTKFHDICYPLKEAWIYGTLRKYAPEIYQRELSELQAMWEIAQDKLEKPLDNPHEWSLALSLFASIYENPQNNVAIVVVTTDQNRDVWNKYLDALKTFCRMNPSAELYLKLAEAAEAPYQVRVAARPDGFRYYDVRAK